MGTPTDPLPNTAPTPTPIQGVPEGVEPLILTSASQKIFNVKPGEDVTAEKKYKKLPKKDILADIEERGIISDFYPIREKIQAFPDPELLLVYDEDQTYKKNFYLCVTIEATEKLIGKRPSSDTTKKKGGKKRVKSKTEIIIKPQEQEQEPISTEVEGWVSQGSEDAIREENVFPTRELLKISLSRKRKEFGGPFRFNDSDAHDGMQELRQFKNPNFDLIALEKNVATQAVPPFIPKGSQTPWYVLSEPLQYGRFGQVNSTTQTDAGVSRSRNNPKDPEESQKLQEFFDTVLPMLEYALHQNETMDMFRDDYAKLAEDELLFGDKSDNFIKEFQTFTDFEFSRDKSISALDWKPGGKGTFVSYFLSCLEGVVAVSCCEKSELDERSSSGISSPSVILVWDFVDPIHPQMILEAPSDVLCFRYNPKKPNIMIAGCMNGQVCFWNLEKAKKKELTVQHPELLENNQEETKKVFIVTPFSVSSSVETGHKKPVTDLAWLSNGEIEEGGKLKEGSSNCTQFITIAGDGLILIWDMHDFIHKQDELEYEAFDLRWKPSHSIRFSGLSKGIPSLSLILLMGNPGFRICCTTEEGDLMTTDWETLKKGSTLQETKAHFGNCVSLVQSPFFPEIFLTAGDWSLHVWQWNIDRPLVSSPCGASYITVARWSPTRPGVFFAGRSDGTIDIWDLSDKSHIPALVQHITSVAVTSMAFLHQETAGYQLLAIGDITGRLHILEVPPNLSRKSQTEKTVMERFFQREEKRVEYVKKRANLRKEETKNATNKSETH